MLFLVHPILLWATGPGVFLFTALMLTGGVSGAATGDPIPALEGLILGLLEGYLPAHLLRLSTVSQSLGVAFLLYWTVAFIGMQLRCLFAPPGFEFETWSPVQIFRQHH
jgi:hypothetical protein